MRPASSRPARRGPFRTTLAWWLALGLLLVLVPLGMVPSAVEPAFAAADEPVVQTDVTFAGTPEPDGRPVRLDATVLETGGGPPRPAIVLNHGFGGDKTDTFGLGRDLARRGYVVLAYTQRGFGASGGQIHLVDPAYEGRDASRAVDLLARRPEVARVGNDPVVGFAGASYGGAVSLVAAGVDRRIDAIAPAFTWNSLDQALFPQYVVSGPQRGPADVVPVAAAGVFKQRWAALFFRGGGGGSEAGVCGRFSLELCRGYRRAATTGQAPADLRRLLRRIAPTGVLGRITAPTLLVQGETDTLFPLSQAEATARGLPAATPKRVVWSAGGHDGGIDLDALLPSLTDWFGRYLKADGTPADPTFRFAVPQTSLVRAAGDDPPQQRELPGYPGLQTAFGTRSVALAGPEQRVSNPPGGVPAALTNLPGTGAALSGLASVGGYPLGVLPGQAATFTSAPSTTPQRLVGGGRVRLRLTSDTTSATLFVSMWDLGPDRVSSSGASPSPGGDSAGGGPQPSSAVLPQLALAPIAVRGLTPDRPSEVEVALPAVAHEVPVGHRLQLVVSSTDQAYAVPAAAASYRIALVDGTVTLPDVVGVSTTPRLDVPLPLVIVVGALLLAGVAGLVALALARRAVPSRPDLRGVPLRVENVVKTYRGGGFRRTGFRAVDGVSFAALPGQVVGLLGPNGAGKTSTMRMLVGLMRPDSGAIYVRGEPVQSGAEVLGQVGALIEGPGFLPHLSGLANLEGYWAVTGRPPEQAHLEGALTIAGLGDAIHRTVRGYSQGMRQRLGIAQAMLGLPDLLLLDEPTNGLDPPQIKAMRTVLADYAAAGRTVVISSHLLAEVQQTCSHVVVMNQGRVVLEGSVAELTSTNDVTLVGLADPEQMAAAVAVVQAAGARASVDDDGLRVHGDLTRPDLVLRLVEAGIDIDSIDGHRQLEEVFMNLVGDSA